MTPRTCHVDYQRLFKWDTIELPTREVELEDYDGAVGQETVESITAHHMTLQQVTGREHSSGLPYRLATRRIARTDTPEGANASARDKAAER
ncbi:hypothetical protein BJF89_10280 [Corynebacterium sp. CNJ-954]|uniref:hypothetical protein n=1 Tax=Corynebacterium sp. CNJ-954 TaxID=1904962 RepID=UPI000958EAB7|nr:hypothetical protein [Corynebacterium sp. CNJ-954]OLT50292.1 hypothetical protein BJF89_10280 [Corynebacterium sp. CNJ-954]